MLIGVKNTCLALRHMGNVDLDLALKFCVDISRDAARLCRLLEQLLPNMGVLRPQPIKVVDIGVSGGSQFGIQLDEVFVQPTGQNAFNQWIIV